MNENDITDKRTIKEFKGITFSKYKKTDAKKELLNNLSIAKIKKFSILLQSFSYKNGLPRNFDMILDCRFLKNPYWISHLKELDGRDKKVQDFVCSSREFKIFFSKVFTLIKFLISQVQKEGKSQFSIGFGCTGGQHRSVVFVNMLSNKLNSDGHNVLSNHRDIPN